MNFEEALESIKNGKTVKRKLWNNKEIYLKTDIQNWTIIEEHEVKEITQPFSAGFNDMLIAEDWTIVD